MDDAEELRTRLDALEAEQMKMRETLSAVATWASRYGVAFPNYGPTPGASAGAGTAAGSPGAPVAAAKKPITGEQLLVRFMYGAGLLVLLVGAAVILPATLSLMSVQTRDIIGVLLGLAILAFGASRRKRTWIVDGAVALGAGLEYLSLWNAFHLHLAPVAYPFALMFATTLLVGALGYVYRSERLAFAGLAGGVLTPILLSTDQANPLGLCTYLAVLAAAGLGLSILRNFRYLEFAVFATLLLYSPAWAWSSAFDAQWTPHDALGASGVFFLEFAGALLLGTRGGRVDLARQVLLSLELCAFALMLDQRRSADDVAFLGAFVAFTALLLVAARMPSIDARLRFALSWWGLGGSALLVQGLLVHGVGGPIAIEAAVLAGIGARRSEDRVRFASAAFFLISACLLPFDMTFDAIVRTGAERPFLNPLFALGAMLIASLAAAIEFERGAKLPRRIWLDLLRAGLHVTAPLVLARQAYDLSPGGELGELAVTLVLTLYAAGLLAGGIRRKIALLRIFGAVLFFITVCKVFVVDLAGIDPGLRFLSFLVLGGALVVAALFYKRAVDRTATEAPK